MTVLWRLVLVLALMFWQGGFTFYASVVVPVGSDILGSHVDQGWITRSVTNYLNLSGAVALALWLVDIVVVPTTGWHGRKVRFALWCVLALTLAWLCLLHQQLDALLDATNLTIRDQPTFHLWHRVYLYVSTVQWLAGIFLMGLTLATWRRVDAVSRRGGKT
jgi:hypothetical protein